MKAVYPIIGFLLLCVQGFPQIDTISSKDVIFTFVEEMPEFSGGDKELVKFLQQNIAYPQMEMDNDIQGKVIIKFVVNGDGSVSDVTVVRNVSPGLDKEAVRVVQSMPQWKPGKQQGKFVRVYYMLPIVFKLQDNTPDTKQIEEKMKRDENFRNAIGQYKFQKWEDAIKYLKKSIKEFPSDYRSYELKAECELKLGKKKDACAGFKEAKKKGSPTADKRLKEVCN